MFSTFPKYSSLEVSNPNPLTLPISLPIYFFGGITGNDNEVTSLAKSFSQAFNEEYHSEIFLNLYRDPGLANGKLSTSLENQATLSVDEMMRCRLPQSVPFHIVGYSYGCLLGTLVTQKLKQLGYEVKLFLIDSPAFAKANNYFTADPVNSTNDLLIIANHILKGYLEKPLQLTQQEMEPLSRLGVLERFKTIQRKIELRADADTISFLEASFKVVEKNLNHLINYQSAPPDPDNFLNHAHILLLNQTLAKYQLNRFEWRPYVKDISYIEDSFFNDKSHLDLIANEGASEYLGKIIFRSLFQGTSRENICTYIAISVSHRLGINNNASLNIAGQLSPLLHSAGATSPEAEASPTLNSRSSSPSPSHDESMEIETPAEKFRKKKSNPSTLYQQLQPRCTRRTAHDVSKAQQEILTGRPAGKVGTR